MVFNFKRKRPTKHFSARTGAAAACVGSRVFVFGGTDVSVRLRDLFEIDVETGNVLKILPQNGSIPEPRSCASLDAVSENSLCLFGGHDGRNADYFNDVHLYDLQSESWKLLETFGQIPAPRTDHATCAIGEFLYVFGGFDGHQRFGDLCELNSQTGEWRTLSSTTSDSIMKPRFGHSLSETARGLVSFGGWDGKRTLNETWLFDFSTKKWTKIECVSKPPHDRYRHRAAVVQKPVEALLIFGGVDQKQTRFNDVCLLDLTTHAWSEMNVAEGGGGGPSVRTFHAAAKTPTQWVVLGGYDGVKRLNDVWTMDLRKDSFVEKLCALTSRAVLESPAWKITDIPLHLQLTLGSHDGKGVLRGGIEGVCERLACFGGGGNNDEDGGECRRCRLPASQHVPL